LASILELDEKLNQHFNIFCDAPENERKRDIDMKLYGGAGGEEANYFI